LIVRLHSDASRETFEALSRKLGARSVSPIFSPATPAGQHPRLRRSYLVRFPVEWELEPLQRRYAKHAAVEAVEVNRLNRPCAAIPPNDPNYGEQWNLSLINMSEAWRIEQGDPEVTVAVVDGGIDPRHPEFRSQLWQNGGEIPGNGIDDDANGYVDDINGWDFSDAPTLPGSGDSTIRDNEPQDEIGHGTHVSGIIAAAANNGIGIAGIAPRCRLMPLRADFKYGGGGYLQNDDVAAAIVYAADNGARVINMSWGDTVNAFIIEDAIAYANAHGCILIAAAGNDSAVGSWYPAGLETVISVAALGKEKHLSSVSNFGATIDIAAPGEEILTTDLNGGFQHASGTSMAAPHVSGVAALIVSAHPNYTNTEVRDTLIATAGQLFVSPLVGAGLLDAYAALTAPTELIAKLDTVRVPMEAKESDRTEKIEIFGSAGGIGFSAYSLEYGIGEVPDLWFPLGTSQARSQLNACLYKWETSDITEGRYTVRLSVTSKNGEIKRDRTVVDVRHAAPLISNHASQTWFAGDRISSVVMWETDERAIGRIDIFQTNGDLVSTAYSDSENLLHIVNLSDLGIPPGVYRYRLSVENRAGFLRVDDNDGLLHKIDVQDAPIDPLYLSRDASTERGLNAVGTPVDLNGNGKFELVAAEIGTNSVQIFEIADGRTFTPIFSFSEPFLPRAIADTDNDGHLEILCNPPEVTFLLEQSAQGEFPTKRIWEARGNWGRTIVDADADGTAEILTRDDSTNAIFVYEAEGDNSYRNTAILENPTVGDNGLSVNLATGDFDGDGQTEILAADDDGDVFIYETTGDNRYSQTWITRLDEGEPELFASGDMDADGKDEFAICAKTGTEVGPIKLDIRYHHWLLTVFASDGDDSYRPVWRQRVRDIQDGGNGMTIADADNDGQNELCIAVAPNFYLVQHDGTGYRPIWHHRATNTLNPIVAALNGDGENALLFNSDNVLTVFTTAIASNGHSAHQQSAVATRRPRLS
ncbi:S8 family serine peptidase, partial [Candidatus Poribacteria bacterium]|nr:S8 family serine peptidase [Candidatus Poribacteria bacterium]